MVEAAKKAKPEADTDTNWLGVNYRRHEIFPSHSFATHLAPSRLVISRE